MSLRPVITSICLAILLTATPVSALTDTWDGGGADNTFLTAANWLDNTAPAGGFLTDIIFAGTTQLTPNLSAAFSANSVTFNSTAGLFNIGGSQLNVGTVIVNDDILTKTFSNAVSFSTVANATVNVASGDLRFNGAVTMPFTQLSVVGARTAILGGSLAVGPGLTLSLGTGFIVSGGTLTRDTTGVISLAAGEELRSQSGGDVTITGTYTNSTASTIRVTGAGSTFSTTSTLTLSNGSTVDVLSGGALSSGTFINTGSGGGSVTVDGTGSTIGCATVNIGSNGSTGTLTLSNGSTGTFTSTMNVDNNTTVGSNGTVNIQTAATVNAAGLAIAPNAFANTGLINVVGTGSALTLTGAATATIGAASASSGALNVQAGGTFTSGSGLTTVNATGTIALTGGTLNLLGNLILNGGQLTRDATGVLSLAAGKTLTAQAGGDVAITGGYANNSASTITVTGAGSTFATTGSVTFGGGSTANALAGGSVSSGAASLTLGSSFGGGTMSIDGTGSSLSGAALGVGLNGGAGNLTLSNSGQGTFGAINVDASTNSLTTGALLIQSGADVTGTSLTIAPNAVANSGTVTVNGSGSTLTLTAAATAAIGGASASSGTLNIQNGGVFTSGSGLTTVNATGTIALTGGTFNLLGNLTLNGGTLTRDTTGVLTLSAGQTMTAQSGGDVTLTGAFFNSNSSSIIVTGAGSTFSTTSTLTLISGSTVNVQSGGALFSGSTTNIGTGTGGGAITVDGAGSTMGGAAVSIGASANTGTLTLSNGSTGTFTGTMNVDNSVTAGSDGTLNIQSAAAVNAAGLVIAPSAFANTGVVNVTGTGSAFTLIGAATATIGAASASSGTLNVQAGGTFTSGTDLTTVNATGDIVITGGTYSSLGNLTLNGGQITRDATGVLNLAAGKTLTAQGGGDVTITGGYTNNSASTITVTGSGSSFTTTGSVTLGGGSTANVLAGGSVSSGAASLTLGSSLGGGTMSIDGTGSSLSGGLVNVGLSGGAGNLTLSNSGTGTFGTIAVDASSNAATTGSLLIQSGADVTGTSLIIAPNAVANSGIVTINGSGSTLSLTGAATAAIGAASASSGILNVQNGGVFTNGTGVTGLNSTGVINVSNSGAVVFGGGLSHQGTLNAATGTVTIGGTVTHSNAARTFLTNNVTASFTGNFTHQGGVFDVETGSTAALKGDVTGAGGFTGGGTVSFSDGSALIHKYDPGPGPVSVSFGGNVVLGDRIVIEIGGTVPGTQHDRLNISGNVSLFSGTFFEMHFINGFAPVTGQTFDLIDAAGSAVSGQPIGLVASGLRPGWQFTLELIPASGIVRLTSLNDGVSAGAGTVWNGGGTDNLLTTPANWIGNTAPPSSLTSGLLVFTGGTRTAPQLTTPFSARGVHFSDNGSTESFNIAGPQTLSIGSVGIFNDTYLAQTFNSPLDFSGVPQSWIQGSFTGAPIVFNGTVTLPTTRLNLQTRSNSSITLRNVIGTGAVSGQAEVILSPTAGVQQYDLSVGTITTMADGSTDVFGSSASLDTDVLSINESLTLDGAPLTAPTVNLAAGKTWRIQNGSVVDGPGIDVGTGATVIVSGAGSELNSINSLLSLDASEVQVLNGGKWTEPSLNLTLLTGSALTVNGAGSNVTADSLILDGLESLNDPPAATFSDHSTAAFSGDVSIGVDGLLRVESGAVVTFSGSLEPPLSGLGVVTIAGVGSILTINGTQSNFGSWAPSVTGGTFSMPNQPMELDGADLVVENGTLNVPLGTTLDQGGMTIGGGGTSHVFGDIIFYESAINLQGAGTRAEFHGAFRYEPSFGGADLFQGSGNSVLFHGPVMLDESIDFGSATFEFRDGVSSWSPVFGRMRLFFQSVIFGPDNVLTLRISTEGGSLSGNDVVGVDGTSHLGGTLKILHDNIHPPEIGDSWQILYFGAAPVGNFAAFDLPTLPAGLGWDVSQITTTGELSVKAITPLEQWRLDHFGTAAYNPEAGNLADPDHDGIANLLEYALGLDPQIAATVGQPTVSLTTAGVDQFLTLTFTRKLSATDVTCEVQVGSSVISFLPGSHYGAGGDLLNNANTTQVSRTIGATTETIVVRDLIRTSAAERRFMRLAVRLP